MKYIKISLSFVLTFLCFALFAQSAQDTAAIIAPTLPTQATQEIDTSLVSNIGVLFADYDFKSFAGVVIFIKAVTGVLLTYSSGFITKRFPKLAGWLTPQHVQQIAILGFGIVAILFFPELKQDALKAVPLIGCTVFAAIGAHTTLIHPTVKKRRLKKQIAQGLKDRN